MSLGGSDDHLTDRIVSTSTPRVDEIQHAEFNTTFLFTLSTPSWKVCWVELSAKFFVGNWIRSEYADVTAWQLLKKVLTFRVMVMITCAILIYVYSSTDSITSESVLRELHCQDSEGDLALLVRGATSISLPASAETTLPRCANWSRWKRKQMTDVTEFMSSYMSSSEVGVRHW